MSYSMAGYDLHGTLSRCFVVHVMVWHAQSSLCYDMVWYGKAWYGKADMVCYDMARHGMVWLIWYSMVRLIWYGMGWQGMGGSGHPIER